MNKPLRILMIEDSEDDALLVIRAIKRGGYDPTYERLETPAAMRDALRKEKWDIILSDHLMPGFSSTAALEILKETAIDIPFIIISGNIGEEIAVEAMKAGAHDYIMKDNLRRLIPVIDRALQDVIVRRGRRQAEELYKTLAESSLAAVFIIQDKKFRFINNAIAYAGYMAEELIGRQADTIVHPDDRETIKKKGHAILTGEDTTPYEFRIVTKEGQVRWIMQIVSPIQYEGKQAILGNSIDITGLKQVEEERVRSFKRLRKALGATVQAMSVAVEAKDPYTAGHQRRVADLARSIAIEMGLSSEQVDGIRMASAIHDIGKIAVPSEILSRPTILTEIEFSLIKTHAQAGYDILKDIEFPWPIARIILEHHERIDGSGYPNGLTGEKLLIESRILSVADVVEAIASHRPYRPARGISEALDEITKNRGILYDSSEVDACVRLICEKCYSFDSPSHRQWES